MSTCHYAGSERPRQVTGRHLVEGCECKGCEPCGHSHCAICRVAHAAGTCPECMAETRESLREIGRMCDALPAEVEHRGVEGEAMMLLGPSADPEATGHLLASIRCGRVPADYLEIADDERHPLFVLATWAMLWRDVLEHEEPTEVVDVASELDYLDQQMTYMSGRDEPPFEDFAQDIRQCERHLESVLHDGEQVDRGAPCMTCERPLLRVWSGTELPWSHTDGSRPMVSEDAWACARCKTWRSESEYRLNVAEDHLWSAEWLTDQQAETRTKIKAGTIREWARDRDDRPALVKKRRDSERVVYLVADVERVAREKGMMAA